MHEAVAAQDALPGRGQSDTRQPGLLFSLGRSLMSDQAKLCFPQPQDFTSSPEGPPADAHALFGMKVKGFCLSNSKITNVAENRSFS